SLHKSSGAGRRARCIFALNERLALLEYHVRKAVPDKLVERVGSQVEPKGVYMFGGLCRRSTRLGNDAFVLGHNGPVADSVAILHHKARYIPDLVGKVLVPADAVLGELNIVTWCRADYKAKPHGVGPVLLYHVEGIDNVAQRLGHLAALAVAHESM